MTMDGMPNAHTNIQQSLLRENEKKKKEEEEEKEAEKDEEKTSVSNRHETTKTRTLLAAWFIANPSLDARSFRICRSRRWCWLPQLGLCICATEYYGHSGPSSCCHRIISNLFHHFTIRTLTPAASIQLPAPPKPKQVSKPASIPSFCLIGKVINRYQEWKLNKYCPTSYPHVNVGYEWWSTGEQSEVETFAAAAAHLSASWYYVVWPKYLRFVGWMIKDEDADVKGSNREEFTRTHTNTHADIPTDRHIHTHIAHVDIESYYCIVAVKYFQDNIFAQDERTRTQTGHSFESSSCEKFILVRLAAWTIICRHQSRLLTLARFHVDSFCETDFPIR